MHRCKTVLTACALAWGLVGLSQPASAQTEYHNPWGAVSTDVRIGNVAPFGQYIAWRNVSADTCSWQRIGDATGLFDNSLVVGADGAETIHVARSTFAFCGFNFSSLVYGGYYLDIFGSGGNDFLSSGTGNTWIHGQNGNDWIWFSNPSGVLSGGAGNDDVMSDGTGGSESLYGNGGNDCLRDANRVYNRVDCGVGNDAHGHYPSDPGVISCEQYACCGLC